jgi:hypothetical protein
MAPKAWARRRAKTLMTSESKDSSGRIASANGESIRSGGSDDLPVTAQTALERLARSFETSARRWELIVYPTIFGFIILASYGFFLIYSLTQDMHVLAGSIDPRMANNLGLMAENVALLSTNIETMTGTLVQMQDRMASIDGSVGNMNLSTREIAFKMNALELMRADVHAMNMHMLQMTTDMNKFTRPESLLPFFR